MAAELTAERFWSNVDKRGAEDCWHWAAAPNKDGYGHTSHGYSHRLAWQFARGPIPEGMYVCHSCDNRRCCNPAHLFLGTHLDNMRDRDSKRRAARGDRHYRAKLTDAQVAELRAEYSERRATQRELATRFGVSVPLISMIVNNKHRVVSK